MLQHANVRQALVDSKLTWKIVFHNVDNSLPTEIIYDESIENWLRSWSSKVTFLLEYCYNYFPFNKMQGTLLETKC